MMPERVISVWKMSWPVSERRTETKNIAGITKKEMQQAVDVMKAEKMPGLDGLHLSVFTLIIHTAFVWARISRQTINGFLRAQVNCKYIIYLFVAYCTNPEYFLDVCGGLVVWVSADQENLRCMDDPTGEEQCGFGSVRGCLDSDICDWKSV